MVGTVVALAKRILEDATKYKGYYSTNNLVAPTFDATAFPEPTLPADILAARESLLDASSELQDLVRGPKEIVRNAATHVGLRKGGSFNSTDCEPASTLSCRTSNPRYEIATNIPA